jgi:hypothetical protein
MNVFELAPDPKAVDGLFAVPIHLDEVVATLLFDAESESAHATATMRFTVGPTSGNPVFDLRQTIAAATLDGAPLAPAQLAHHDLGGGPDAEVRVLDALLAAGSSHELELSYPLELPAAPNARGVVWEPGAGRLSFDLHLSDLNPARYLESWLPSNLLFDRFPVRLEVRVDGTPHAHVLLTNGAATPLGPNRWQVELPATFAPCSPMLLIEAADRVQTHVGTAAVGGTTVALELMKRASDPALSLPASAASVAMHLAGLHASVGPYLHGTRYAAYLTSGPTHSMEYAGGTTSQLSALHHEVFHSWWARGMVPAHGEDGWLDEAWTTWNTGGAGPHAAPIDMSDPPVALWTNNPFVRRTHGAAYGHGASVFAGVAGEVGVAALIAHMAGIYQDAGDRRFTTPGIEAELIRRSGHLPLHRIFDRFVYGHPSPAPGTGPELFLRDAPDDIGITPYSGAFWHSPDVWVRNADDGGTTPQAPEHGQDNWIYARVRNRGDAPAGSFAVGFKIQPWAGSQFVYPADWFPLTAAAVGFDVPPGGSRIVKARWRSADVPPSGTHGCLLAVVYGPQDPPQGGAHVWEDDNLAQRNLTVVNAVADEWIELPFWAGSFATARAEQYTLELRRPKRWPEVQVELTAARPESVLDLFRSIEKRDLVAEPMSHALALPAPNEIELANGRCSLRPAAGSRLVVAQGPTRPAFIAPLGARLVRDAADGLAIRYETGRRAALPVVLAAGERRSARLRVKVPAAARPGDRLPVDLLQRDSRGRIVGGFTVVIDVTSCKERS